MSIVRFCFLAWALWATMAGDCFAERGNCGGDGPQPFQYVTLPSSHVQAVGTSGSALDLMLWEKKGALLYRNTSGQLRGRFFGSADYWLANLGIPFAKLVDESESYVVTEKGDWFLDAGKGYRWIHIQKEKLDTIPLFWKDDRLYMVEQGKGPFGTQLFRVWKYEAGQEEPVVGCMFRTLAGEKYYRGEGHSYPHAIFYKKLFSSRGYNVDHFKFNVDNCRKINIGSYKDWFKGEVRGVYRFEAQDSYAIVLDHTQRNLLWDSPNDCNYFHIGNREMMVPDFRHPVAATWNGKEGLKVFNLETGRAVDLFKGGYFASPTPGQFATWKGGKEMFASLKALNSRRRWLFKVNIGEELSKGK